MNRLCKINLRRLTRPVMVFLLQPLSMQPPSPFPSPPLLDCKIYSDANHFPGIYILQQRARHVLRRGVRYFKTRSQLLIDQYFRYILTLLNATKRKEVLRSCTRFLFNGKEKGKTRLNMNISNILSE